MAARRTRTLDTLDLVGGTLGADFVNTVNARPEPEHDYLGSYADLLRWSVRAGALSADQADVLGRAAHDAPKEAGLVLNEAHTLRETLHQVLSALAAGTRPPEQDLHALHVAQTDALAHAELTWQADHYGLGWPSENDLRTPLWPVAHAAGTLLCSAELRRLKACPNCGWLFLDDSKNGRRRWCRMDVCGVSDKMRRYHERRVREGRDGLAKPGTGG